MRWALAACIGAAVTCWPAQPARAAEIVLVEAGSSMRYQANHTGDGGAGTIWTAGSFDASTWLSGEYGVGYERGTGGATNLLRTTVPVGAASVYTRTAFDIADVGTIHNLFLGADYDDGTIAWINGVEVFRSSEMPPGAPTWNTRSGLHESSNGTVPVYTPLNDISAAGIAALNNGSNVMAIGVWNAGSSSSDLVLAPRLSANRPVQVERGPYLQMGTSDSVVVRWRTSTRTTSRVVFGLRPDELVQSATAPGTTREHSVRLDGLLPDTRYNYAVGTDDQILAGADDQHVFTTAPLSGTRLPRRIWVIGDSGTADSSARAVRDAYRSFAGEVRTDLWLMLGDNAYPDGTQSQYQAAVFDMYTDLLKTSVVWPTLGNHDGRTAQSSTQTGPYYNIFTLPAAGEAGGLSSGTEAYYSFDHANIHFICLDSHQTSRSPAGAMMTWLQQDALSTAADWVIAFWHHPPYSKGSHDSDTETRLIEMRRNALPLLEDAGVDLVLAGHSHSYERSVLLDGHHGPSWTLSPDMTLDTGDGREDGDGGYRKPGAGPIPHQGAVHVVAGSSGRLSGGRLNHPAMHIALNRLGSLVLDVDGLRLDATFLTAAGTTEDRFSIIKGSAPEAVIQAPATVECSSASGTRVEMDGSFSTDADSSGEREDIAGFAWFEDFGLASQVPLGQGEIISPLLSTGRHHVTLRVTDRAGLVDTEAMLIDVVDGVAPELIVEALPPVLWPPNGRMVEVIAGVTATDACGATTVELTALQSQPTDSLGSGKRRAGADMVLVEQGPPDRFLLRAERQAAGEDRVYRLIYTATDAAGNSTTETAVVTVPHDHREWYAWTESNRRPRD